MITGMIPSELKCIKSTQLLEGGKHRAWEIETHLKFAEVQRGQKGNKSHFSVSPLYLASPAPGAFTLLPPPSGERV